MKSYNIGGKKKTFLFSFAICISFIIFVNKSKKNYGNNIH